MVDQAVRVRLRNARLRQLRAQCVRNLRKARSPEAVAAVVVGVLEEAFPGARLAVVLRDGAETFRQPSGQSKLAPKDLSRAAARLVLGEDSCAVVGCVGTRVAGAEPPGSMAAGALWSEGEGCLLLVEKFGRFDEEELELIASLADLASCFLQGLDLCDQLATESSYSFVGRCAGLVAHDLAKQLWALRAGLSSARRSSNDPAVAKVEAIALEVGASLRQLARIGKDQSASALFGHPATLGLAIDAAIEAVGRARSSGRIDSSIDEEARGTAVPVFLASIVENLLDNALLASTENCRVSIRAVRRPCHLVVRVENGHCDASRAYNESPGLVGLNSGERLGVGLRLSSELLASIGGRVELRREGRAVVAEVLVPILADDGAT